MLRHITAVLGSALLPAKRPSRQTAGNRSGRNASALRRNDGECIPWALTAAKKACAEKDAVLRHFASKLEGRALTTTEHGQQNMIDHALSQSAGSDYVYKSELDLLRTQIRVADAAFQKQHEMMADLKTELDAAKLEVERLKARNLVNSISRICKCGGEITAIGCAHCILAHAEILAVQVSNSKAFDDFVESVEYIFECANKGREHLEATNSHRDIAPEFTITKELEQLRGDKELLDAVQNGPWELASHSTGKWVVLEPMGPEPSEKIGEGFSIRTAIRKAIESQSK